MILDEIAEYTRIRVENAKKKVPAEEMKRQALELSKKTFAFEKALNTDKIGFICEVKKASPSKGLISPDFDYIGTAKQYDAAGASAISVLTEPKYFQGDNRYLTEIKENVSIPVLRKDFTVDEYMIYEARVINADCILLICAILSEEELTRYLAVADSLGLSAIVEAHDEDEVNMALRAGARIIGVNNRDLKTFTVDIENSIRLRKLVSDNVIFVAESGIKTRQDIKRLESMGVNAVLIGETLMRSKNISDTINELKGH